MLEEIATNNAAVFQTLLQSIPNNCVKPEYIKSEVSIWNKSIYMRFSKMITDTGLDKLPKSYQLDDVHESWVY